jgi:hypothetical protein
LGFWSTENSVGELEIDRTIGELADAHVQAAGSGRPVDQLRYWPEAWSYWTFTPTPIADYVMRGSYADDAARTPVTPLQDRT